MQYFCGYSGYDDEKLPFDPSLMVYLRKRLTPEVLDEINEMIVRDAKARQTNESKDDNDSDNTPGQNGNSSTMIGFRKREGLYPSRILADKVYRNRELLQGAWYPALGSGARTAQEERNQRQDTG